MGRSQGIGGWVRRAAWVADLHHMTGHKSALSSDVVTALSPAPRGDSAPDRQKDRSTSSPVEHP